MKGLVSQANVLARIGALGGIYGVDLSALEEALGTLGPELARGALITVPITFDQLSVATRVARERLDGVVDADQLRRVGKLAPDAREVVLELAAGRGQLVRSVRVPGDRSLPADCEQLANFGVGTLAIDALQACAASLGVAHAISDRARGRIPEWLLHFARSNRTAEQRATTRAQVIGVAKQLGATVPQCNLVDGLHDMLAKDRDSFAALLVSAEQTTLQLAVRWEHVRWETAVRMAIGFLPALDPGKRLGELAGAFDAEDAAALELVFGPKEPPEMRIAVTFAP